MTRYAMAIDVERCVGCQACLVACKQENEVPTGYFRLRSRETVAGLFPNLRGEFRMEQCFHCEEPPCVEVCPVEATYKNEDGLVVIDQSECIGCRRCIPVCPYNMRYQTPNRYIDKCSFCDHRLEQGLEPACVETCPTGARIFGDLEDPNSPVSNAIQAAKSVDVLRPEAGTSPNLFYLNSQFVRFETERPRPFEAAESDSRRRR